MEISTQWRVHTGLGSLALAEISKSTPWKFDNADAWRLAQL